MCAQLGGLRQQWFEPVPDAEGRLVTLSLCWYPGLTFAVVGDYVRERLGPLGRLEPQSS